MVTGKRTNKLMLHQITNIESVIFNQLGIHKWQQIILHILIFSGCTNGVLQRHILTTDTNQTLKYVLSPDKSKEINSIIL